MTCAAVNLRSVFFEEPLIEIVGHAFNATTYAFGTLGFASHRLTADFVLFAFGTC
jgi:hypothetical protein